MNKEKKSVVSNPLLFDEVWKSDAPLTKINPAQIHRRRLIKNYLLELHLSPKNIMDLGCGTGELLSELTHIYPEAKSFGCDSSNEAGNLIKLNTPYSEFHLVDIEKIDPMLFKNRFDLITCSEVLEHCSNPRNIIKNSYEWLIPGGLLFITVPSGFMTGYDKAIGHVHHYTTDELVSLLKEEGFTDITANYWGFPFHMLYRHFIGLTSSEIRKTGSNFKNHYLPIWFFCKIFNLLFYLNFKINKGYQIFAWGYKPK